jgi:hypothetical protein
MSRFDEKLTELQIGQKEVHTLLNSLKEKLDDYISEDDQRHKELVTFRSKSTEKLSEVSFAVKNLQDVFDKTISSEIPKLSSKQATHDGILKTHSWLLKAVIGVSVLSILGGTITSFSTCYSNSASADEAKNEVIVEKDEDE